MMVSELARKDESVRYHKTPFHLFDKKIVTWLIVGKFSTWLIVRSFSPLEAMPKEWAVSRLIYLDVGSRR